jgi:hypothetical protein
LATKVYEHLTRLHGYVFISNFNAPSEGFVQTLGAVTAIRGNKSSELAQALERENDVMITTLQTFRFAVAHKFQTRFNQPLLQTT